MIKLSEKENNDKDEMMEKMENTIKDNGIRRREGIIAKNNKRRRKRKKKKRGR